MKKSELVTPVESLWSLVLKGKGEFLPAEGDWVEAGEVVGWQKTTKGKKKIIAPILGRVKKKKKKELKIAFRALRLKGRGVGGGRGWGVLLFFRKERPLVSLSQREKGKVLVVEELTPFLVKKGAVLGVKGFVGFKELFFSPLKERLGAPVVLVEKKEERVLKENEGEMVLVDGDEGQLLIPLKEKER